MDRAVCAAIPLKQHNWRVLSPNGELLDPFVKAFQLIYQIAKSHQMLLQSFQEQRGGQAQYFQPVDVLLCPVAFPSK